MKNLKTIFAVLLCVVLCCSIFPAAAFADGIIILGSSDPAPADDDYAPALVLSGTETSVFDNALTRYGSDQAVIIGSDSSVQAAPVQSEPEARQTAASDVPSGLAGEILEKTNEVRRANGLSALRYSAELQTAADTRARESAVSFTHTRPDGSSCHSVIERDYYVAGENLLQVTTEFATAELILDTWMNSDSHRANILLADFTELSVGMYEQDGTLYISQIFLG